MTISERAKAYAIKCHEETNHKYGDKPYSFHLDMVVSMALNFHPDNLTEHELEVVIAACWCHDVIEDCRQTYNDVAKATHPHVAEIVYALTNEKGRNRKERANEKYYAGIRANPFAVFVKSCDRAANTWHSINTGSRMANMYREEMPEFIKSVFATPETYPALQKYLLEL
jgi:(p)ppGpp synthase/HD superfamily hydrolase